MNRLMTAALVLWALPALAQTPDPQPLFQPQDQWAIVLQQQGPEALAAFQAALRGPYPMTVDPTLETKTGRITLQIDQQIKAPSSSTLEAWDAYLHSQWAGAMAKVAQRLIAGKYTLLGLRTDKSTVQRVWGPERGISLRFTRSTTTITAHIDVLAGM